MRSFHEGVKSFTWNNSSISFRIKSNVHKTKNTDEGNDIKCKRNLTMLSKTLFVE